MLTHGVVSGAISVAQGGSFESGFISGAVSAGAGGLAGQMGINDTFSRVAIAAIVGGTSSVLTGGKFANGAVTAAFALMYNNWQHRQGMVGTQSGQDQRAFEARTSGRVEQSYLFEEMSLLLAAPVRAASLTIKGLFEGLSTTTLYRAVGRAEFDDILTTGAFRASAASYAEGKFFAETAKDAAQWGRIFYGQDFHIVGATFSRSAADSFMKWQKLDGIGPARFGTFKQMGKPRIFGVK